VIVDRDSGAGSISLAEDKKLLAVTRCERKEVEARVKKSCPKSSLGNNKGAFLDLVGYGGLFGAEISLEAP